MAKQSFQELIAGSTPVLVDFSAEWCGPCQMQKPMLEELAQKMGERLKIVTIDVDKNPKAASHYRVQGVPTLMLFKEGKRLWSQSGVVPAYQLQKIVQPHLNK
jgi:thioredoxin 1